MLAIYDLEIYGMALTDSYSLGSNRHQNESSGYPNSYTRFYFIQFPEATQFPIPEAIRFPILKQNALTIQHGRGWRQRQRLLVQTWAMKFITYVLTFPASPINHF